MKKIGYLLSLAIHALLLLAIVSARFAVTIRPESRRVVAVTIAEPPPPYFPGVRSQGPQRGVPGEEAAHGRGQGGDGSEPAGGRRDGSPARGGAMPLSSLPRLDLSTKKSGTFRLAPVGKSPDPWAVPLGPPQPSRLLGHRPETFRSAAGGASANGGMLLLPFDIREKAVADWAGSVLARIERNWIIPASGRLAFSGRVQITLTIERQGQRRTLVIDDSTVPETLTLAALQAVQSSLPFPPLPENVAGTTLAFTFVFSYNG